MENEMTQKLNWEVELRPIDYAGNNNTDRYALVRNDTQKLIGIRSKNYHPVYNRDLELIKNKILKVGGFNFKGYQEFSGGTFKTLLHSIANPPPKSQIGNLYLNRV